MKKYIYIIAMTVCGLGAFLVAGCSDDDFANQPQTISVDDIVLTPIHGGCEVQWTPDPEDHNFVFLHVEFTDHDNKPRAYNVSRYGSELVTPFEKDKEGNLILNEKGEAVKTVIRNLINQEYTLNFYAYNNENERIGLGSRTITPLDYKQCDPDSIYGVKIVPIGGKKVKVEWKEPPLPSSSTSDKVFFRFDFGKDIVETHTVDLGIRHAELTLENTGKCFVEYGTVSAIGKEWMKTYVEAISVVRFFTVELWEAKDKVGWIAACESDHNEGRIDKIIDGTPNTYWSCNWEAPLLDKYIIDITLPEEQDIVGIILQQRQTNAMMYWRLAKHFSIEVKDNNSDKYTTVIEEGTLTDDGATDAENLGSAYLAKQNFDFTEIYRTKEIRLSLWEPLNKNFVYEGDYKNLCMGEFGILIKDPNKSEE